jgi:hypothetical protein
MFEMACYSVCMAVSPLSNSETLNETEGEDFTNASRGYLLLKQN